MLPKERHRLLITSIFLILVYFWSVANSIASLSVTVLQRNTTNIYFRTNTYVYLYNVCVSRAASFRVAETGEITGVNPREISNWSKGSQDVQDQGPPIFVPESWGTWLLFLIAPKECSGTPFQCGQGFPHTSWTPAVCPAIQLNSDIIYLQIESDSTG